MWKHFQPLNYVTSRGKPQGNFAFFYSPPFGVRVCMCAHMWEYMFVHTHVEGRGGPPHHAALHLPPGQDLLLNPRLFDLANRGSHLAPGTSCLSLPREGTAGTRPWLPVGVRDPISSPHTCIARLYPLGHPPGPVLHFARSLFLVLLFEY